MFLLFLKSIVFFATYITGTHPPNRKQQEDKQPYAFWIKDEFMKYAKQQSQNH